MKTAIITVLGFLLATPVANAWVVGPPPVNCTGTISDETINTNLIVPPNTSCTLKNVTVTGNVDVEQGASLKTNPSPTQKVTINGNVVANQCKSVDLSGNASNHGPISIGGNVSIQNCTGNASLAKSKTIGGNVVCSGNASCEVDHSTIQGNLTVDNNNSSTRGNDISTTTVSGNVDFSGNTASAKPGFGNTIFSTTIGGNLNCINNTPPATNEGAPNTVTGTKTGQCANL